jgi:hypothetical protein
VRIWHLPSLSCLASFSCGGPRQHDCAVRRLCWLPPAEADSGSGHLLLLTSGDDGCLQVWQVCLPTDMLGEPAPSSSPGRAAQCCTAGIGLSSSSQRAAGGCRLLARFVAAARSQDCITALHLQHGSAVVWVADSSGHVVAWDMSSLQLASSDPATTVANAAEGASSAPPALPPAALPLRVAAWRAAEAAVVSLQTAEGGDQPLLLVGSQDAAISVWTQQAS